MTFRDIFKSDFLENMSGVTVPDMIVTLALAFALGMFLYFIYRKCYSGVMYSPSFGVTLIAQSMITAMLILTVVSNVVLSLGMVGALSIVRFRTAIKEPMDIAFLFWSIAVGIVLAAGLIPLAVFGSLLIGAVLWCFARKKTADSPYILVVRLENSSLEEAVENFVGVHARRVNVKSKSVEKGEMELNYEVRLRGDDSSFVSQLAAMEGVGHVVLVSYNGDYMG